MSQDEKKYVLLVVDGMSVVEEENKKKEIKDKGLIPLVIYEKKSINMNYVIAGLGYFDSLGVYRRHEFYN